MFLQLFSEIAQQLTKLGHFFRGFYDSYLCITLFLSSKATMRLTLFLFGVILNNYSVDCNEMMFMFPSGSTTKDSCEHGCNFVLFGI